VVVSVVSEKCRIDTELLPSLFLRCTTDPLRRRKRTLSRSCCVHSHQSGSIVECWSLRKEGTSCQQHLPAPLTCRGGEAAHHPEVEDPDDHQRPGARVVHRSAQTAHLHLQHRPEGGVRHQVLPRAR
ncbi:hypothetical protein KUCAC02_036801, partial [Chaenocephalus aceratus]